MMVLQLLLCAGAALAAPATYDQRQEGPYNVRADVQNVVLLVAIPSKTSFPPFSLDMLNLLKNNKNSEIQERADTHVMDAFVEPPTPYHVEIGESTRSAAGEVVIAARRGASSVEAEAEGPEELKLLGATEQCGPGRSRDLVSMMCQDDPVETPEEPPTRATPDAAPAETPAKA